MGDKYGYLANPNSNPSSGFNKKWLWIGGGIAGVILIAWLIARRQEPAIKRIEKARQSQQVRQYTVTAPVTELRYDGSGMPYGIPNYITPPDVHIEVDNNGIARLVSDDGVTGGIVRTATGQYYFVSEFDWNQALDQTRLLNTDHLLEVMPYAMVPAGYLAYCTSGSHIGESVYVTLSGQIGRALNKADGGMLMFVPLDVIDQTEDIWKEYVKPR